MSARWWTGTAGSHCCAIVSGANAEILGSWSHQVHRWRRCRLEPRISVQNGARGAPLYAGWLAAAEIADQGQVALRMQADHPEGAGPRALGTRIAELLIQDDSGGDVVASQGPAGTGRHARSPAPEAAYLGTVQAQRLVLHDAQSGGVDAEATLVPGDTSHLAGAAAGTKLISDDQSSHD